MKKAILYNNTKKLYKSKNFMLLKHNKYNYQVFEI